MDNVKENSLKATEGGTSQAVAISSTSAASTAIGNSTALIYATTDCFMRKGAAPTALATGVDQFIPASTLLRIDGLDAADKLAFKTTGATGSVYITPGA